jgi:transketolase
MGSAAYPAMGIAQAVLEEKDRTRKLRLMQCLAQEFRITVLDILHAKGTGHWGGASSAAELLVALYFDVLNVHPEHPGWEDRDRVVVSKGHASAMIYTVMAHRGYFPIVELDTFRQLNSRLQGHPCMNKLPGIEMSTGALGHGLSVSTGMALAARILRKRFWTYVIIGDGDMNEGQTWEGIMTAAKFRPEHLVALVDYNKVQLDGPSDEIMPMDPLREKFCAFNWNVAPDVYDGHDMLRIADSFDWIRRQDRWPAAVIYRTVKGKGVSFMENNYQWHGAPVDDAAYSKARPELAATLEDLRRALP